MHLPPQDTASAMERKPYETPVVIDYGDVVTITKAGTGATVQDAPGDDGVDDQAYISGGG